MKKINIFSFLLILAFLGFSQTQITAQNAIDFDGTNDFIAVPNASSLIANGNLSMSFWAYPTNPAPNYPNFDGMAGFRNDANADFYILHLNATTVEARFRNSAGVKFDVVYSGVVLNAWNHFALTYDGTELTLYHNGVSGSTISASGTITNTTQPFNMGYVPFSSPNFYFDGKLDDVALWSKALTPTEVTNLYNACNMDLTASGLKLCYEFNQGVAGGNNAGLTTAVDSKGNINGTLSNFALTGTASNYVSNPKNGLATFNINTCGASSYTSPSGNYTWTTSGTYHDTITTSTGCDSFLTVNLSLGMPSAATISKSACNNYLSPSGNFNWSTSGTYTDIIPNWQGCDSVITVNLSIYTGNNGSITVSACENYVSPSGNFNWSNSGTFADLLQTTHGCDSVLTVHLTIYEKPDVTVTRLFDTLKVAEVANGVYQWLDCDNGNAPIAGATSANFGVMADRNYAVAVSANGCSDTSACFSVVNVGTFEPFAHAIQAFPNPTTGDFWLDLGQTYSNVTVQITNAVGQTVSAQTFDFQQKINLPFAVPAGVYFVKIAAEDKQAVLKIVKK